MKTKQILHDTLDIDHGLFDTFLSLFSDPKKVVTHPQQFTKPWKYATYVVTISCVSMWFIIHTFIDPSAKDVIWNVPMRILELSNGYKNFYENTQPLKRLLIHSLGIYLMLGLLLHKKGKTPALRDVSLYLIGHSVLLQFVFQTIGVFGINHEDWYISNMAPAIGAATNVMYLLYALMRIYDRPSQRLLVPLVIAIEMGIYGLTSTRLQHFTYYSIFNGGKLPFDLESPIIPDSVSKANSSIAWENSDPWTMRLDLDRRSGLEGPHMIYRLNKLSDSLSFVTDCYVPSGEIARVNITCYSPGRDSARWAINIFEKTNRYSPDVKEILLKLDDNSLFAAYRIPNDSNATIFVTSINTLTGHQNYKSVIQSNGDDIHVHGAAADARFLYLCGNAQNIRRNFELGVIIKIDKKNGASEIIYSGDASFGSSTTFTDIRLLPEKIEVLATHNFKRFFVFQASENAVQTFTKPSP